MRTTIDIDDQLLLYAKHQAVKQGCTIKQILEDALRDFFSHQPSRPDIVSLETFSGAGLKIPFFMGIGSAYEAPMNPELIVNTNELSLEESVKQVLSLLHKRGVIADI